MQEWALFWYRPRIWPRSCSGRKSKCTLALQFGSCMFNIFPQDCFSTWHLAETNQVGTQWSWPFLAALSQGINWATLVPACHTAGFDRSMTSGRKIEQRDIAMLANYHRKAISQGKQKEKKNLLYVTFMRSPDFQVFGL